MPAQAILGDAATATFADPFQPYRPRAQSRAHDRTRARPQPQRAWATPLDALLVAERAALLADRDDEFTMLVTIGYTGMRWGETIGLVRYLLLSSLMVHPARASGTTAAASTRRHAVTMSTSPPGWLMNPDSADERDGQVGQGEEEGQPGGRRLFAAVGCLPVGDHGAEEQ
jgi:hypothetical protein